MRSGHLVGAVARTALGLNPTSRLFVVVTRITGKARLPSEPKAWIWMGRPLAAGRLPVTGAGVRPVGGSCNGGGGELSYQVALGDNLGAPATRRVGVGGR